MGLVEVRNLHKEFKLDTHLVQALRGIDLNYNDGELLGIRGSSGSGKTTLLNLIGCLDYPTSGEIFFDGDNVSKLNRKELTHIRAQKIGFVFQTFNLIPTLSALENVEYPLVLLGLDAHKRYEMAAHAIDAVGLTRFMTHRPAQLSGGQRQRVAIARAIVKKPRLILADEPTANLDVQTAGEVLDVMVNLNKSDKVGFIFSSHDPMVLSKATRRIHLVDGRSVDEL